MELELCQEAMNRLDTDVLILDGSGDVVYANVHARNLIDAPTDGAGSLGAFAVLWQEDADTIAQLVRRLGGTSEWQPFSLKRASGGHAGLRMAWRGRAFMARDADEPALHILVMTDVLRERSFEDHRGLIRQLNHQLQKGLRTEQTLNALLETQKKLHRELVHRVKNNLALLSSLLRINRQRSNDPAVNAQLQELERRVMSVAAVHDILDRNAETDFVRADQLIDRICEELQHSLASDNVRIERDLSPIRLHVSDATPLALIINELVTNALKHAFPAGREGHIRIGLRKNGVEKLEATIFDDGVGINAEAAGASHGSGSRIIEALALQLGGELVRQGGDGTAWQLIFPPSDEEGRPTQMLHS